MAHVRTIQATDALGEYLLAMGTPPDDLDLELFERTRELGDVAGMQIGADQGAFLAMLVRLTGARTVVEVGTFTGYSALAMARALPPGGQLIACDISDEYTSVGREFWQRAGVNERIDLRIAPAIETLRGLPEDLLVDLAFIDADKDGYIDYYEEILKRMRSGGLIIADNVLFSGWVVDPDHKEHPIAVAIQRFNEHVRDDARTEQVVLPIGDGVSLIRKI